METLSNVNSQATTVLTHPGTGATVYLMGSSHTSRLSAENAHNIVQALRPEIVVLELDEVNYNVPLLISPVGSFLL